MIKLSRLTDYAVTLLTHMVREEKGVWSASDMADRTGLPLPTVSKVMKRLAKSDIITATRGASGGYRLGREAVHITVASIIEAMDGPISITDCANGGESCRVEAICGMQGNWSKVNRALKQALESVSLADMAGVTYARLAVGHS